MNKKRIAGSSNSILALTTNHCDKCCEKVQSEGGQLSEEYMRCSQCSYVVVQKTPRFTVDLSVTILV